MNKINTFRRSIKIVARYKTLVQPRSRRFHVSNLAFRLLDYSPSAQLDKNVSDRYMCLPMPEMCTQVSYVWVDGKGVNVRSKTKTLDYCPTTHKDCPNWSFDGSSSFFGSVEKSDFYIVPIAMYPDPFRRGNSKIVLCETFTTEKKPTRTNHREECIDFLNRVCEEEAQFGFEQEFYFLGPNGRPYGWPEVGIIPDKGENYGGVGAEKVSGREIIECIYRCSLYCGVDIHGCNAGGALAKWKFCTGPTANIKAADDIWMLRYILCRVAEDFGVTVSIFPQIHPDIPGSGLYVNLSTKKSRCDGGVKILEDYIKKLEKENQYCLKCYDTRKGAHNRKRLTGKHKTPPPDKFIAGVGTLQGNRAAHVRLPAHVADKKKGHLQDRRPAANADPYQVIAALVKACLMKK